jgi:GNAT superfamily N-acetyltransferase
MTQIRKMLEGEAEQVLGLWDENCREAAGAGLAPDEARGVREALRQYAGHPQALCLVAEEESRLVGFVTARLTSHPILEGVVGEIEELYVRPEVRRRGIGAGLVKAAVSLLRERGASTVRAVACTESERAREFWGHLGWENDLAVYSLYAAKWLPLNPEPGTLWLSDKREKG